MDVAMTNAEDRKKQAISVNSQWYIVDLDGLLVSLCTHSNFYINIDNYLATGTPPIIQFNKKMLENGSNMKEILSKFN